MVVGDDGTKGGLWCSPVAKTSRPTSSALRAMVTIALIRSCSLGVRPEVGSVVTSPTVKIPNCIFSHRPIWLTVQPHEQVRAGAYSRSGPSSESSPDPGPDPARVPGAGPALGPASRRRYGRPGDAVDDEAGEGVHRFPIGELAAQQTTAAE